MDYKREIIEQINSLSGSKSPYEVFGDWVKIMALVIQNMLFPYFHNKVWHIREEQYLYTVRSYGEDARKFQGMMELLVALLDEQITDALGEIYMEIGLGNRNTSQFFTPFHISYTCTQLLEGLEDEKEKIRLIEPSCGSGGMIIAAAKTLKDKGINYQKKMDVVAQDLDWKAVYMTYVQLSLLGIRAEVVQGDTLVEPYGGPGTVPPERVFYTPLRMGVLL